MKLLCLLLGAALLAAGTSVGQCAEAPSTKPPAVAPPKVRQRPFHGTIKTVDKGLKAIVLNGEKAQTFFIISETKIKKNGKPATFDQIVVGDSLGGFARERTDGKWEALTLNVGLKTPPPAAAPAKGSPAK